LESSDGRLCPIPLGDGPVADEADWRHRDAYFNGAASADPVLRASHLHRTNSNQAAPGTPAAHRIFRQGYEYLEDIGADGLRLGLNFISFQNDLYQLRQVLGLQGWLGDANFGGGSDGGPRAVALTFLRSGGFYVVPPRQDHGFPGAALLGS
jgi:deferrochelatase/peroxidase EfeB